MTGREIGRITLAILTAYMNGMDDELDALHLEISADDLALCLAFAIGLADHAYRQIATLTGIPVEVLLDGLGQGVEAVAVGDGS
jgi:hypothetical protein